MIKFVKLEVAQFRLDRPYQGPNKAHFDFLKQENIKIFGLNLCKPHSTEFVNDG